MIFSKKSYTKLVHNENNFYVPLWHNEVIYDISGNKLYVSCNPELPEHMTIDDNNNLHVHVKYHISEIYNKDSILINIGKKKYSVAYKELIYKGCSNYKICEYWNSNGKSKKMYMIHLNDAIYYYI